METVKLYTKSRQILQRNVFRHCTDFTFPVSLLFLRLGPGGGGISHYDGSQPRSSAGEVWLRFRHLSLLLGLNMAGCLAADKARLQGAFVWWGQKQTYTEMYTTCLWTKESDISGKWKIAFRVWVTWIDKQDFTCFIQAYAEAAPTDTETLESRK